MTRAEHLEWAKERALAELDYNGDLANALVSIGNDLDKHPETAKHTGVALGCQMLLGGLIASPRQMREFIEGFN